MTLAVLQQERDMSRRVCKCKHNTRKVKMKESMKDTNEEERALEGQLDLVLGLRSV